MDSMDAIDKLIVNRLQEEFPLVAHPYAEIGAPHGITEDEVIRRLAAIKELNIVRQISAIFDTRTLGYKSSLVAMSTSPEDELHAAHTLNAHPGVSHNYKRNHEFNIWFTIAVPSHSSLERTVEALHQEARAVSTRILPTLKLFKIGVTLDMTGEADPARQSAPAYGEFRRPEAPLALSAEDIMWIRALQEDMPLVPRPYAAMAGSIGRTEAELFAWVAHAQERGQLRRVAAVLHHRKAGFRANGMAVWKVPAEQIDEVGNRMAHFTSVSHCYQRPTYPDWPYSVFSMIHARTVEECELVANAIAVETGITERAMLYSSTEFRKIRLRYFTPELDEWEAQHLAVAGPAA
ncbi:MAG: AsnC-type helix-turn-helix domain [Chloroflexi bacterium]|nr:AsnC-type helix-turn-helix domain [Chloroflexota bacterium]